MRKRESYYNEATHADKAYDDAILSTLSLPNWKRTDDESIACMIDGNEMIRVNVIIEDNAVMLKIMKQPHDSNGEPRPIKYMLDDRLIEPDGDYCPIMFPGQ